MRTGFHPWPSTSEPLIEGPIFQDIYAMTCSVYDLTEPCKVGEVSWDSAGTCANTIFFPSSSGTPMPVAGIYAGELFVFSQSCFK